MTEFISEIEKGWGRVGRRGGIKVVPKDIQDVILDL